MELSNEFLNKMIEDGNAAVIIEPLAIDIITRNGVGKLASIILDENTAKVLLVEKMMADIKGTLGAVERIREIKKRPSIIRKPRPSDDDIKAQVVEFLGDFPGSTRKELIERTEITSGTYNRIIGELKDAGDIRIDGEKRNAKYYRF